MGAEARSPELLAEPLPFASLLFSAEVRFVAGMTGAVAERVGVGLVRIVGEGGVDFVRLNVAGVAAGVAGRSGCGLR